MDFVGFIIGISIGVFIGYRICDEFHKAVMPDMFRRLGVTPEKLEEVMHGLEREIKTKVDEKNKVTISSDEVQIKIEQHGQQLFIYRKEDNKFLGQGGNFEEIVNRLEKDFRNVKFTVTREDGADLLKKDPA